MSAAAALVAAGQMSEADLLALVRDLARRTGWRTYHTHDSRRSEAGWPDLVLVRRDRLITAELKTDSGRLTREQRGWLRALADTAAEVYVWRPADWLSGRVARCLTRADDQGRIVGGDGG